MRTARGVARVLVLTTEAAKQDHGESLRFDDAAGRPRPACQWRGSRVDRARRAKPASSAADRLFSCTPRTAAPARLQRRVYARCGPGGSGARPARPDQPSLGAKRCRSGSPTARQATPGTSRPAARRASCPPASWRPSERPMPSPQSRWPRRSGCHRGPGTATTSRTAAERAAGNWTPWAVSSSRRHDRSGTTRHDNQVRVLVRRPAPQRTSDPLTSVSAGQGACGPGRS